MYTVDKVHFIAWLEGILLDFKNGRGIAVNEPECEEAARHLDDGEKVLFCIGSELTGTYCIKENGIFVEKENK